MVLLLNYLPWIITLLGLYAVYLSTKIKNHKNKMRAIALSVIATIAVNILLSGLTAGYIPKQRASAVGIPVPAFESTDAQIQDRLRAPERLGEDSEARFNELTDWREHLRQEAVKEDTASEN